MVFLVPAVLAGAGAVAAPVIIHLLNKHRVQVVPWGATRFLLQVVQQHQSRLKLEELLLLLLRCLLFALLALAFARPVLHPGGTDSAAATGPATAVVLLDQSASMGQSNGVTTRFEQGKAAARNFLDALPPGSQAALLLVSDRLNPVIARPTANLALVRRALDVAELTQRASNLPDAVRAAVDLLRPIQGGRKEIDLVTDNQSNAWEHFDQAQTALAAVPDIRLQLADLGNHGEDNLAITALRAETAVAAAGQPLGCLVEVSNFGASLADAVRVTLAVDSGPPVDEMMLDHLNPGQVRTVRLGTRFPKAGFYTLTAAIPADRLPMDNQHALAVHVIDRLDVAIVEGGTATAKQDRDAFFLANALVPVPPARRTDYYLKTETKLPEWLQDATLDRYRIVFLSNVGTITPNAARNLQKYVREGGSVVVFPGNRVKPDAYNKLPVFNELLPATLGELRNPGGDGKVIAWQAKDYRHPVTALWNNTQGGNLGSIRATQYFPLTPPPAPPGGAPDPVRVLVAYADGTPAVAERLYGKGHVVLFSSAATTDWTNLPIHPDFVPLVQRLTGYLAGDNEGADALRVVPGGVFQTTVKSDLSGRELAVTRPGDKGAWHGAGKVELTGQEAVVRYRDTEQPGGYRFKAAGSEDAIAAFAVQVDPRESDLKVLPTDQLDALTRAAAPGAPVAVANAPAGAGSERGTRRELWLPLVIGAAVVALIEMVLAQRFSLVR